MHTKPLSDDTKAGVPFVPWDATTVGASDPTSRDWPRWQDFEVAGSAVVSGSTQYLPEREKRRSLGSITTTGPSEMDVLPKTLDATQDDQDSMAILEMAAVLSNEAVFVQTANQIDWLKRPAAGWVRAVRLALAAGAHLLARNLATQGSRLYSNHLELQKMAGILAPPRVVRTNLPPDPSLQANYVWLKTNADEYLGQWVALREGELVTAATTIRELRSRLESTDGVLITKVF